MGRTDQGFDDSVLAEWFEVLQALASVETSTGTVESGAQSPERTPPVGVAIPAAPLVTVRKTKQSRPLTVAAVLFVAIVGGLAWLGHLRSVAHQVPTRGSSTPTAPFTTIVESTVVPTTEATVPAAVAQPLATTSTAAHRTVIPHTATAGARQPATSTRPTVRAASTTVPSTRPPSSSTTAR